MDLVIDAGNTLVKFGFFSRGKLDKVQSIATEKQSEVYKCLQGLDFDNCIVGSVVTLPSHFINYLKSKSKYLMFFDEKTLLPIKVNYSKTSGSDRIALSVAANALYPNENCLIIGMGTCITYNFVSSKGVYSGGAISPGMSMRYKALNSFTSKLPLIENNEDKPITLIGKNTESSILSGVVNGMVFEIQGFIKAYREKYSSLHCILCGGDSRYIGEKFDPEMEIIPELGLYGLHSILKFNAQKKN